MEAVAKNVTNQILQRLYLLISILALTVKTIKSVAPIALVMIYPRVVAHVPEG